MDSYSFQDVSCSLVGPGIVASLGNGANAADEGIDVAPTGEKSTMSIGADGSGIHNLFADKSGTLTVRLLKNSPMNPVLSQAYALQTSDASLHGQNAVVITNRQTGEVITCTKVAFKKAPDLSYAKESKIVEWQFNAIRIERQLAA
jgi:hypothetical protein